MLGRIEIEDEVVMQVFDAHGHMVAPYPGTTDIDHVTVDFTTDRAIGLDAASHLADNNSTPYLEAVGDLLVTGPTQTNVNDLVFVFVWPENVGQIANSPRP